MNYTRHFECGCKVVVMGELTNALINYCPKHKAAPDMYEALKLTKKTVITKTEDGYLITYDALRAIIKALAKAEGK